MQGKESFQLSRPRVMNDTDIAQVRIAVHSPFLGLTWGKTGDQKAGDSGVRCPG